MKAVVLTALTAIAGVLAFSAPAQAEDLLAQAEAAYAKRDFTDDGILQAQGAAHLYSKLVEETPDTVLKAKYLIAQSGALYFVGTASQGESVKIDTHLKGYETANQALEKLGVDVLTLADLSKESVRHLKASQPEDRLRLIAEALYHRGVNLGQWGAANGVVESMSRWPELRRNMELIEELGQSAIYDFGPARTLGRGYFKIPPLLGGSVEKAADFLGRAMNGSKAGTDASYSTNGLNNLYYAEVLHAVGKKDEAKTLLKGFVDAPLETLNQMIQPENREAKKLAEELLQSWN